jgi:hypothetical protein
VGCRRRRRRGSACHTPDGMGVLVAAPYDREMNVELRRQMFTNLLSLECANEGFNLYFALFDEVCTGRSSAGAYPLPS